MCIVSSWESFCIRRACVPACTISLVLLLGTLWPSELRSGAIGVRSSTLNVAAPRTLQSDRLTIAVVFLHPYDETPWEEQLTKESLVERTVRATVHAKRTLMAGYTTVRCV